MLALTVALGGSCPLIQLRTVLSGSPRTAEALIEGPSEFLQKHLTLALPLPLSLLVGFVADVLEGTACPSEALGLSSGVLAQTDGKGLILGK